MTRSLNVVYIDQPLLPIEQLASVPGVALKTFPDSPIDSEQLIERARDAEVLIIDLFAHYDAVLLDQLPNVSTLISVSVGTDHIDLDYCQQRGIEVVTYPGYNARAVAEAAFAYLLALLRKIPHATRHVLGGGWDSFSFTGSELKGKTLGVVGAGKVGSEVIEIARGLEMKVVCHTLHPSRERARNLGIANFVDLDRLLKDSDVVLLAIPATKQTTRLINAQTLDLMKPTAYLINTARWQTVDALDLAEAIYQRKIAGAALDFIAREPYDIFTDDIRIQEMINSPNVMLLPHIGFNTEEAQARLRTGICSTLERLAKEAKQKATRN